MTGSAQVVAILTDHFRCNAISQAIFSQHGHSAERSSHSGYHGPQVRQTLLPSIG
jgi:hypothetical protein